VEMHSLQVHSERERERILRERERILREREREREREVLLTIKEVTERSELHAHALVFSDLPPPLRMRARACDTHIQHAEIVGGSLRGSSRDYGRCGGTTCLTCARPQRTSTASTHPTPLAPCLSWSASGE
jgi:hypothetical protein